MAIGTIRRIESFRDAVRCQADTLAKVVGALEGAGIEFLNDDKPGVRLGAPKAPRQIKINIGRLSPAFPVTPPGVRVRTGRFGGLSYRLAVNFGIPSESK